MLHMFQDTQAQDWRAFADKSVAGFLKICVGILQALTGFAAVLVFFHLRQLLLGFDEFWDGKL